MKKYDINCIKVSSDGKYIVIGYDNGVIEKYKLKKVNNCYIEESITILNKVEAANLSISGDKSQNNEINENKNNTNVEKIKSKGKSLLKSLNPFKKNKKKETDNKLNKANSSDVEIIFR